MEELNDIPKKNPFKVPDNYFEELNGRILLATRGIEPSEEKRGLLRRLRPVIAAAASVAAIAIISYLAFHISQERNIKQVSVGMTVNELVANYINDIDLSTLEEVVAGSESFGSVPDVGGEDIIEYLISENINILEIYEQL